MRYQVEVYETRTIEIRAGDMIRWTRNDPARGLANGDRAEVVEIGPRRVSFRGGDGRAFTLSRRDMQLRHLDHAWSSTVHGAQGITRDNVIAVLDSGHGALTDQATFYVELTRARDRVVVLTDNREDLMAALEAATGERVSALEAVGEDPAVGIMDREELWPQLSAWRAHEARAAAAGLLPLDMEGHGEVIARLGRLAARRNLPCPPPAAVTRILEEQEAEAARRAEVEDWLGESGQSEVAREELGEGAEAAGVPLTEMPGWREWRDAAERRAEAGRRLLNSEEYRPHVKRAGGARSDIDRETEALEAAVALDDECAALLEDWRAHGDDAEAAGIHPFHGEGYGALAARLEEIAGRQGLPAATAACMTALLEEHQALVLAGEAVRNALPSYRKMDKRRAGLLAEAQASGVPITDLAGWKDGREEAGALIQAGRALLEGRRFGVHLDRDPADRALVECVVAAAEADALLAGALETWRTHARGAEAAGLSPFDAEGTEEAMAPLRALAARDDLPAALPQDISDLMDEHAREMRAEALVDDWKQAIGKLRQGREDLAGQAVDGGLAVAELPGWPEWRNDAGTAMASGRSLLQDTDCAPRLDRNPGLRASIQGMVRTLTARLERDRTCARLIGEWNAHVGAARAKGVRPSTVRDHAGLAARMEEAADRTDLDAATAVRLKGLLRENQRQEREQVEQDIDSQHERLLKEAGGNAELLPYQFDYVRFREAVTEARNLPDPGSDYAGELKKLDAQMDAAEERMALAKALRERALSLRRTAQELDRRLGDNPGVPMHRQRGFRAWRREADRFLDDWRDALRNRLMEPHLDEAGVRGLLERSASTLQEERYRAPQQTKR
ncbi:MAG: hypothetical protein F4Y03_11105, partial [Alphaproteobacteria bacterium]|nr:hypothetical protein [Alphaproteobacteria bacterium]